MKKSIIKKIAAIATCAVMVAPMFTTYKLSAKAYTDDHGNSPSTATTFSSGISGTIDYSGDIDYLKDVATSTGVRYFSFNTSNVIVQIHNSSGTVIATSSNTVTGKHFVGYNLTSGNTYYISVISSVGGYGQTYTLSTGNRLSVSHLYQTDPSWSSTTLYGSSDTIGQSGCLITAFAMVTNYYKGTNYTPLTFNNSTYLSGGDFQWSSAANAQGFSYTTSTSLNDAITSISRGKPIIIRIQKSNGDLHFVVATGYSNGVFYIKDPGTSNSANLALTTKYPGCTILKYHIYSY